MIKRFENWLRLIFSTEFAPLKADLVTVEARLRSEINATITQRLDELSARTSTNVAEAIVRLQQTVDSEVQQTKNTIDQTLNHYRASQAQCDADELLRHPRHKR